MRRYSNITEYKLVLHGVNYVALIGVKHEVRLNHVQCYTVLH